jgi:hypothetical protein
MNYRFCKGDHQHSLLRGRLLLAWSVSKSILPSSSRSFNVSSSIWLVIINSLCLSYETILKTWICHFFVVCLLKLILNSLCLSYETILKTRVCHFFVFLASVFRTICLQFVAYCRIAYMDCNCISMDMPYKAHFCFFNFPPFRSIKGPVFTSLCKHKSCYFKRRYVNKSFHISLLPEFCTENHQILRPLPAGQTVIHWPRSYNTVVISKS